MESQQKKIIIDYLTGPRDYAEGVAIYQRFGFNLMLKRRFALDESQTTREMLFDELRKIAGLSDAEFARLPRIAKSAAKTAKAVKFEKPEPKPDEEALIELADSFGISVDELVSPEFQDRVLAMEENEDRIDELTDELEKARSRYAAAPEPVRKMIRFREKYPFLDSPDCPDVLKVLVSDMFTAYGKYKEAFVRLQVLGDEDSAKAAEDCETVVTEYLKNREIWEELEYYRDNGVILGKAEKFREIEVAESLSAMTDVELIGKLRSAAVNVSKNKKAAAVAKEKGEDPSKAETALKNWSDRKAAIEAEIERRKKK